MPYSGPSSAAAGLGAEVVDPAGEAPGRDAAGEEGEAPVDEKEALHQVRRVSAAAKASARSLTVGSGQSGRQAD